MADIEPIGLALQTDGIDKGIKKLDELSKQGPKVEQSMAGIATESKRVAKSLADLGIGAGDGLKKTGEAAQKAATGLKASGTAAREAVTDTASLARAISGLTVEEEKHIRKLIEEANSLRMTRGEMEAYRAAQRGMSTGAQEIAKAMGDRISGLKAEQDALAKSASATANLASVTGVLARGLAIIGVSATVGEFIKMADASTNVASKLKLVTNSSAELQTVQAELFKSAQSSRVNYVELVGTYAQMARATKELNVSQKDMLAITQTISQAVTVSGGSAQAAQAALVQLSQGFASGTLRGEELNSVMEQTPRLAMAIAQGMGVSVGELRKLGSEGKLSAEAVVEALKKSASSVERDFSQMTVTVEQASTNVANSLTRLVGSFDQATGATGALASGMQYLSRTMDEASGEMDRLAKAKNLSDFFLLVSDTTTTMNGKLGDAKAELARLEAQLAKNPNNLFLQAAIGRTQDLITKLTEAKAHMVALETGKDVDPTGRTGTRTRGDSFAAYADAQRKSEQALMDVRAKAAGVNKDYFTTLKTLQEAKALGTISEKSYLEQVTALAKATWDSSTAGKEEAKSKREAASASKSAETALEKEIHAYNNLVAGIQGKIDANNEELRYAGRLNEAQKAEVKLNAELASGKLKITASHEADLRARIAIWKAQEQAKEQTKRDVELYKEQVAAQDEVSKAYARQYDEVTRLRLAIYELRTTTENDTKRLRLEASLIGASNAQRQIAIQLYDLQIEKAKELERVGNATYMGTPAEARKARAEAEAEVERIYAQKAANVAGKAYIDEWKSTIDQVENIFVSGFADMMNNGKSGWESFCKSLKTSFYTLVAKEIYAMFAKPFVVQLVGSFLGLTGGGAGSAAMQVAGGGNGVMSMLSMGKDIFSAITGGFNALSGQVAGYVQSGMNWISGSGGMISQGPIQVGGFASGVGAAAAYGAGALGGIYGGRLIGGGYSLNGGSGNGTINAGTAIGAILGGPVGALLGGLAGGAINRLFGRKLKESGVEGEFGGDTGFEGRLFKYYKGGLFRSSKTTYEDLPEEMRKGLGDQFLAMNESIRTMADAVGLGGSALDGFTAKIKVNLKGLSEEEATKKLQEEFQKIAEQMGGLVLTTEEYTHAGETQLEALARLSTSITLTNEWFKAVGDTLYTVGLEGADMASNLIDVFGGADKFLAATSNYYDKFFTDQEKVANQTRLLDEQLKKLGVETMPASREAFRDYINSIDVTTEAGQKLYASLLQMADVFDLIYSSAENIAGLKEDLNVQLMRAKGDEEGATRLERDKQLRELEKYKDPELVRLQVEVWAAEDKSKKDAEAKQAADDMAEKLAAAQKAAQDLALKNLEAAISREKEYWNQFSADAKDAQSKASSYWTLVTDAAKNLRGSTDDISSWNAAQGMVFIEQAVANARKGLGLSDYDATKSAIEAATGGLVMDNYATQAGLDYDKKVLAGQLSELGDFAGLAKSDAQKQIDLATDQIKRLDDTLKFWQDYGKEQVNATLSVTEAVNALYKLLDPKEQERIRKEEAEKAGLTGGSKPPTYTGGGTLGGTVTGSSSGTSIYGYDKDGRALYSDGSIGARPGEYDKSGVSKNASLSEEQWERLKSGQSVYDGYWLGGKQYGLESYYWDEQKQAWLKKGSFAVGTNYVPYDMTANIHQGERIIPAADNRALMAALNTQGGGNAELVQEVRALRAELQAINANTAAGAEYGRRTSSDISQVTEGGNAMRVATMN
ncbi:tape measure protein [Comamonas sp. 4034]|uniref:tape measure protein n=1 Tax=Comamonas sp. 4034 TaxID=3156455 RepID=UPI003D19DE76